MNGIVIGGLYLPNGNPQPGPKFEYKLKWFERLNQHAQTLYSSGKKYFDVMREKLHWGLRSDRGAR